MGDDIEQPLDLPVLETARLRLRPFTQQDIDWVYNVSLDVELQRWVSLPVPYEREHAQYFVENIAIAGAARRDSANFAIEDSETRQPLGRVGLHRRPERAAEIGFWLAPDARGSGVMTEAVRAVCTWGWTPRGMNLLLVYWHALVGNVASRRVAERAGFTVHQHTETLSWRDNPAEKWAGVLTAPVCAP